MSDQYFLRQTWLKNTSGSFHIRSTNFPKTCNHTASENSEKLSVLGKYVCRSSAKFEIVITYSFRDINTFMGWGVGANCEVSIVASDFCQLWMIISQSNIVRTSWFFFQLNIFINIFWIYSYQWCTVNTFISKKHLKWLSISFNEMRSHFWHNFFGIWEWQIVPPFFSCILPRIVNQNI